MKIIEKYSKGIEYGLSPKKILIFHKKPLKKDNNN